MRSVYLWTTCSSGISALEAGLETELIVGGFTPMNGVLNIGSGTDVMLGIPGCPTGELVLGYWTVWDAPGTLCLGPSTSHGLYGAVQCEQIPTVIEDPVCVGFASDGSTPCAVGSAGCTSRLAEPPARWYMAKFHVNEDGLQAYGLQFEADVLTMPENYPDVPSMVTGDLGSLEPPNSGNKQWLQVGWWWDDHNLAYVEYRTKDHDTMNDSVGFGYAVLNGPHDFSIEPYDQDGDQVPDSYRPKLDENFMSDPIPFDSFNRPMCATAFGVEHATPLSWTPGTAATPYVIGNCQAATYDPLGNVVIWGFDQWTRTADPEPDFGRWADCAYANDVCVYDEEGPPKTSARRGVRAR